MRMSTADILHGPHLRDLVDDGGTPMIVVQPLRFIPVVLVHADRQRRAMAKVAA